MVRSLILLFILVLPGLAQSRFEVSALGGYGGFLEDDNSGGRPVWGLGAGVKVGRINTILGEFTQFRRDAGQGAKSRHDFYSVTLHAEPGSGRVRPFFEIGAGAGYKEYTASFFKSSGSFGGLVAGAGATIDATDRVFIRPHVRAYLWGPGVVLGVAPALSVGWRF